ncbi:hypothetical protein COU54_01990 [Candidatus Pacearchaeota archaeon CG10_big_fil_rev_8_21_14_0_10_31_24]|nr:MAG: hypothetical protein COU54_01990 [Candidatus Pacearchaeota archaeon CG10_big_fil_rev_8_21_14_0_10_31_24]
MNKTGQFFLIAALIISGIIIGFGTIYNTSQVEQSDAQVLEFTEELHSELQQVQDTGTFKGKSDEEIQQEMDTLLEYYQKQNPDSEFVIIFGNEIDGLTSIYHTGEDLSVTEDPTIISRGITSNNDEHNKQFIEEEEINLNENRKKVRVKLKFKQQIADNIDESSQDPLESQEDTPNSQNQITRTTETTLNKDFDLKPGDNLYVVVRKKVKNEEVFAYS